MCKNYQYIILFCNGEIWFAREIKHEFHFNRILILNIFGFLKSTGQFPPEEATTVRPHRKYTR